MGQLGLRNGGLLVHEYVYDVAEDGGAVAVVDLSAKAREVALPLGAVKKKVTAKVVTAFVGVGASLQWGDGNTSDIDHSAEAVGALTANAVFADDANRVAVDAGASQSVVEVTGAPMTAGVLALMVEYYLPKSG